MTADPFSAVACDRSSFNRASRLKVASVIAITSIYVVFMFARVPPTMSRAVQDTIYRPKRWAMEKLDAVLVGAGFNDVDKLALTGMYLFLWALVVPWIVMLLMRRGRPADLGVRWPNRLAWRLLAISFLAALPFLIWMACGPTIAKDYLPQLRKNFAGFAAFYFVNMLSEHFLFQGMMLAAFRPGHRWPASPTIVETAATRGRRLLQWFGLAQPTDGDTGLGRVIRWCGLADHCVAAIIASGALFAVVHISKDTRELILSLPGGMALGYVAYRTNSCLVPLILHMATAGTAVAIMLLVQAR